MFTTSKSIQIQSNKQAKTNTNKGHSTQGSTRQRQRRRSIISTRDISFIYISIYDKKTRLGRAFARSQITCSQKQQQQQTNQTKQAKLLQQQQQHIHTNTLKHINLNSPSTRMRTCEMPKRLSTGWTSSACSAARSKSSSPPVSARVSVPSCLSSKSSKSNAALQYACHICVLHSARRDASAHTRRRPRATECNSRWRLRWP